MLKERLELVEHEIDKVAAELISLYDTIAIKGNASPERRKQSAFAHITGQPKVVD